MEVGRLGGSGVYVEGGLCLLRDLLLPEVTWGTSLVLTGRSMKEVMGLWGLLSSGHSI